MLTKHSGAQATALCVIVVICCLAFGYLVGLKAADHPQPQGHVSPEGPAVACAVDGKLVACNP